MRFCTAFGIVLVESRHHPTRCSGSTSAAIGVHTWIEGYLSPVYRSVLQKLEDGKFDVTTLTKEKDGLMTVLTGAADLHSAISTFNVKQKAFSEFRERP